jgi:hypothetical protein
MPSSGNLFNPNTFYVGSDLDNVSDYLGEVGFEGRNSDRMNSSALAITLEL